MPISVPSSDDASVPRGSVSGSRRRNSGTGPASTAPMWGPSNAASATSGSSTPSPSRRFWVSTPGPSSPDSPDPRDPVGEIEAFAGGPLPAPAPPVAPAAPSERTKYTREASISLKLGAELKERVDNTRLAVGYLTGASTVADFTRAALRAYVDELERRYNDGEPFPPVGGRTH